MKKEFASIAFSDIGVAVASTLIFFIFLVIARPNWVMSPNRVNQATKTLSDVNWGLAIGVSLIGGLAVFFVPWIVRKTRVG